MTNITKNPRPADDQELTWQDAHYLGLDACPPEHEEDEEEDEHQ